MFILTLVLVATIAAVAAVAIAFIAFLRNRLWIYSIAQLADFVASMVHQFRIDETNREYSFQQEQNALKEIAEEQRKQRAQLQEK